MCVNGTTTVLVRIVLTIIVCQLKVFNVSTIRVPFAFNSSSGCCLAVHFCWYGVFRLSTNFRTKQTLALWLVAWFSKNIYSYIVFPFLCRIQQCKTINVRRRNDCIRNARLLCGKYLNINKKKIWTQRKRVFRSRNKLWGNTQQKDRIRSYAEHIMLPKNKESHYCVLASRTVNHIE